MKRLILTLAVLLPVSCFAAKVAEPQIVPAPQSIQMTKGTLRLKGISINCDPNMDAQSQRAVRQFADRLSLVCDKTSSVASPVGLSRTVAGGKLKGLYFVQDASVAPEGYKISVTKRSAVVRASSFNGFLYSLQTLRQMLPVAIYGTEQDTKAKWVIPCCEIEDAPRFAYRGVMLDCCRHFWSVDQVKKVLDAMAVFKLNRFHWHLSEDQGWRIEIDKYPRLTEVGAFRNGTMVGGDWNSNDGIRYGGYYTKDQIRDVIAYAAERGITIVPEIDLPGHMQAALASYPELGCAGSQPQPYEVWTIWGVSKQVLNVGSEKTMQFLEDVLGEVADLFPSEYIHIGGDECPRDEWKTDPDCQAKIAELGLKDADGVTAEGRLQNYVTARMQKFLAGKGKKIIGWDEILEGDLAKGATVMSWRGTAGGIKAATMGYDAIMTPTTYCYMDYVQGNNLEKEPFSITHQWSSNKKWADNPLTLEKVYGYEPLAEIPEEAQSHILGVQCNLWTEYIATPEHLEYMLFPRVLAISEIQWSAPEKKDFARFKSDLASHELPVLEKLGINYRKLD
ncbi:MAG: beta-N-acetylhexosaminidase [Bacteroidales bacterium]|nr:beta-N-acetylhexosaminidase [Bacteroidales bacterium]